MLSDPTWPEAFVAATIVIALAGVLCTLIWSIFRTGQTAIRYERAPMSSGARDGLT